MGTATSIGYTKYVTSLLLQVPPQHDYANPAVETNPKRLAKWIKQLPLMNLLASVRDLLDAVEPCNLQRMSGKTRIRLLELYRETALSLFAAVDDDSIRRLHLSTAQRAQVKDDMGRLCAALACGYKLMVKEYHRENTDLRRNAIALLALYRALEACALTLLHAYRNYQPAPPFMLLDAHQLLRHAERCDVMDMPVVYEKKTVAAHGVGGQYKKLMLLAVTDPYHLTAGTAVNLYQLLDAYAPLCRLSKGSQGQGLKQYVIDLEGDSPPTSCAKTTAAVNIEDARLLDIQPAVARAQERLRELRAVQAGATHQEIRLLNVLVPELEKSRVRQSPRQAVNREARITFGIDAIHYYLSRGKHHLSEMLGTSQPDIEVRDVNTEQEIHHNLDTWLIVNQSANGYLLSNHGKWSGEVRVGNAVGIVIPHGAETSPRLTLAHVRWVRNNKNQRVEVGVEVIPGDIEAVACDPLQQYADKFGAMAALLLPPVVALDIAPSLITPKKLYQPERLFTVRTSSRSFRVRAGRTVMDTALFDRFEFEPLSG